MSRRSTSITLRLTLLFTAVSTAVLLALGLLIGNTVEQHFVEQDMEVMSGKLQLARHLLEKVRTQADLDALPAQLDDSLVGHHGLAMHGAQRRGRNAVRHRTTPDFRPRCWNADGIQDPPRVQVWQQDGPHGTQPWRGIAALLPTASPDLPPLVVAVGGRHHPP